MSPLYLNVKVWQRGHKLFVKRLHTVAPVVLISPSLVLVARRVAEGGQDAVQVVLVFKLDMLLNNRDARGLPVPRSRAGHVPSKGNARCQGRNGSTWELQQWAQLKVCRLGESALY
jgi:hypothetical protein